MLVGRSVPVTNFGAIANRPCHCHKVDRRQLDRVLGANSVFMKSLTRAMVKLDLS